MSFFDSVCEWYSEQNVVVKAVAAVGGGALAVVGGIAAAPAIGAMASAAGLGVAGGTLSGAAAASAGLAYLGGGSLASGGLGMAGGTVVVASVAGATGTGVTTAASIQASRHGQKRVSGRKEARNKPVTDYRMGFED